MIFSSNSGLANSVYIHIFIYCILIVYIYHSLQEYVLVQKCTVGTGQGSDDDDDDDDDTQLPVKEFNFPKMHAHQHVFDHILDKGATYGYSTKLFERLHGPLKKWYLLRTNFKNIAPQACFLLLSC